MTSAGIACVKYLLFVFNLLFAISGVVLLSVGAVIQHQVSRGFSAPFVHGQLVSTPIALIVIGVIIFVVAFFGCCGAINENYCMVLTFSVLLVSIFILELSVGIAGYVMRDDIKVNVEVSLNKTMQDYATNKDAQYTWDTLQEQLKCCGCKGPNDWAQQGIPWSCCPGGKHPTKLNDPTTCHQKSAFKGGCLFALTDLLDRSAIVVGGVAIGIAIMQLFGIVSSCCLAKSIRHKEDYSFVEHHDAY